MTPDRTLTIFILEEYYCTRMDELVNEERFDDSNAVFQEFVVDCENGHDWIFFEDLTNVF